MKALYPEMLRQADGVLMHYVEDLTEHDRRALATETEAGQVWLWQLRKCGTWLVRCDGEHRKGKLLEALIRGARAGSWAGAKWYLLRVKDVYEGQAIGTITGPMPYEVIASGLPSLKP